MKKVFFEIVSQLPDEVAQTIEAEADTRAASISHGDPHNEIGMFEAENIAQSIRAQGGYIEPFLLLAYENRQEYADAIWAELERNLDHTFYARVDGKNCVVIAAEFEDYANIVHKLAADIIDLPCYVQVSKGITLLERRSHKSERVLEVTHNSFGVNPVFH